MCPAAASMIRNRERVKEDFPAPVRPTTPIWMVINLELINNMIIYNKISDINIILILKLNL